MSDVQESPSPESPSEPTPEPQPETQAAPNGAEAPPAPAESGAAPAKPDWLQEKIWNSFEGTAEDGGIDYQKLSEHLAGNYKKQEEYVFKRREDIRNDILKEIAEEGRNREGVPESPDGYTYEAPTDLPKDIEVNIDTENDPLFAWFAKTAHEHGLPQSQFNDLIDQYVQLQIQQQPSYEDEINKLGEYADLRVERTVAWAGQNLSDKGKETLSRIGTSADVVELIEEIMEFGGEPAFNMMEDGGVQDHLTKDDVKSMMADPRYSGMQHEQDQAYIKKVQNAWRQVTKQGR